MLIMGRTRRGRGVIFMTLNSMKGQNFTSKMCTGLGLEFYISVVYILHFSKNILFKINRIIQNKVERMNVRSV